MNARGEAPQQGSEHAADIVGDRREARQRVASWSTRRALRPCLILAFAGGSALPLLAVVPAAASGPMQVAALLTAALALALRQPVVLAVALGAFWQCAAGGVSAATWPEAEREARVLAEVRFLAPAEQGEQGWRADAEVRQINTLAASEPWRRVRIGSGASRLLAPAAGERWQLALALRPPRAALNPGAVDLERSYFAARLEALATVLASPLNRPLSGPASAGWQAWRQRFGERVARYGVDRDADALLLALGAGLTDRLAAADWQIFQATGTSHLVAISGSHVTGLAATLYLAGLGLWRLLARCGWRGERELFAATVALAGALGYALFAGFAVPTQRTLLMLAVWRLARGGARRVGALQTLLLALLGVLLIDPLAPLSAGFWLSFVAMAALLTGLDRSGERLRGWHWLREALRSQWRVTVALAPLTAWVFGSVPLAGMLVNLLAIPYFTLLLVPIALLAALLLLGPAAVAASGGALALQLFATLHGLLADMLAAVAAQPWALWRLGDDAASALLLAVLAGVLLAPLAWRWRLGALLLVAMVAGALQSRAVRLLPPLEVLALDAGNGFAVVVATPTRTVVVDNGEAWRSRGAVTRQRLLPALRARSVLQVDLLMLGRATADRAAGLAELTNAMPVRQLIVVGGWRLDGLAVASCDARRWRWDEVEFSLWPAGGSCALRLRAAGQVLWLAHLLHAADEGMLAAGLSAQPAAAAIVLRRGAASAGPGNALWAAVRPQRVVTAGRRGARSDPPGLMRTGELGAIRIAVTRDGVVDWSSRREDSWPWPWRRVEARPPG